ncbi:hypothetical protein D3C81_2181390 [compost metagenome]
MLDPVRAHALYTQEITALNDELVLAKAEALLAKREQKVMYKTMKEKVRQQGQMIYKMQQGEET